jgi:polygalacturonase
MFSSNSDDFPVHTSRHADLITVRGCHDVAITGEGMINGCGEPWWKAYSKSSPHSPYMLDIANSQRVLLENVTLANSPSAAVILAGCSDVTVNHIRATAADGSPGTSGVEISGQNIAIANSTIDVGEEDIVIKPGGDGSPAKPECANISISNCIIQHGKGILVGNQTTGCLRGLTVSNCTFENTQYGIRLRAERGRGGTCEDLNYDNLHMSSVKYPIWFSSYFPVIPKNAAADKPVDPTSTTPIWNNIRISNLTATGALTVGSIVGLPEQPITNVTLASVTINATKPMEITHAKSIAFTTSRITVKNSKPVITADAEVSGIETITSPSSAVTPTPTEAIP